MEQHGFHFNARRCTGCKTCMLACKDFHDLDSSTAFRQVYEIGGGGWSRDERGAWRQDCFAYYVSSACNHCGSPVCMEVCPTGAMHKNDLGLVSVDERKCIGCGYCALSCPYHAPKVDRSLGRSVKCDGCADRVGAGLAPICVEACPLRALEFGPIGELRKAHGMAADLPPFPDSQETAPSLTVTLPRCMEQDGESARTRGMVRNVREMV